jgi:hypothetical protein
MSFILKLEICLLYLFFSVYALLAVDQNLEQVTGSQNTNEKVESQEKIITKESEEMKKLSDDLEVLKKEIKSLKEKNQKQVVPQVIKAPDEEKDKPGTVVVEGKADVKDPLAKPNPVESTDTYGGFSRDMFMQLQTPDFKKSLMERYQWQILFWNHGNYSNNSDLRKLDSTNQTSIDRTDDKTQFVAGGIQFDNFFPVHPRLDFRFDIWRFGFWGQDQLAGRDANNDNRQTTSGANTVNFGQLYFDWHFKLNPTSRDRISLRVGRQDFRLGGRIHRDFYQDDILDAVVFKWYDPVFGKLDILLVDVFSNGPDTKDVNFMRFLSFSSPTVKNFDGKSATIRHGIKHRFAFYGDSTIIGDHLELTPFYYISYYSGTNQPFGGADRSFQGTSGNFPDKDYVIMRGGRLNFGLAKWFRSQFSYAESFGIDRRVPSLQLENLDVDTAGKSYHLELEFSAFKRRLRFQPSYFYADGGKYHVNGTQYSHGFVSFKGDQVGGLLTDLYWGVHPTAYTSHQGTVDQPYTQDRKSGTQFKHLGLYIGVLENLFIKLDFWRIEDTNYFSNLSKKSSVDLGFLAPTGKTMDTVIQNAIYSEVAKFYPENNTVIMAGRRFGAPLGEEYNLGFDLNLFKGFKVWATAAVFLPKRYFSTAGLVQNAPEGNEKFYGFQLGSTLIF